ncbi:Cell division coordinator CpoB [Zhongshania aliphaticivorans]|uniref:Cell division coordinator CpoB n=1 Tax=Zhongshania aliphaticivorans TaxID=1470434 RepID=A0A5S9Q5B9_9GAMM|nr:tol-pal system protein YbgF [Zhongshania aliphaticivorans]CAA0094093.1 Cell division coordinator CpoB [Zhongshania aliphaticivorans]CAA0112174.1 Cell division coordinator CpoB [Zhongshania aliphaticivorans]
MRFIKPLFLLLPAACLSAQLWAQVPVVDVGSSRADTKSNRGMEGEMYQQLQLLRQEIMALRGTVEEQGYQLRQLKQQSLDRYIDIDRRLTASSDTAGSVDVTATVPAAISPVDGQVSAEESSSVSNPTAPSPTTTSSILDGDESSDYAKSYSLVKSASYKEAITAFTSYVEKYPSGRYTPNAWYWLGELYVAVKPQNLPAATEAFQRLLTDYPNHGKVPAAMYKLGTVYFLNDDKTKSQEMLTHVIDRYGNTGNSAVNKSREFLRKNF